MLMFSSGTFSLSTVFFLSHVLIILFQRLPNMSHDKSSRRNGGNQASVPSFAGAYNGAAFCVHTAATQQKVLYLSQRYDVELKCLLFLRYEYCLLNNFSVRHDVFKRQDNIKVLKKPLRRISRWVYSLCSLFGSKYIKMYS